MTLKLLKQRFHSLLPASNGLYTVSFNYKRVNRYGTTRNTRAIDRIREYNAPERKKMHGYTLKNAYLALWGDAIN
jgi:hypothetical protein